MLRCCGYWSVASCCGVVGTGVLRRAAVLWVLECCVVLRCCEYWSVASCCGVVSTGVLRRAAVL